MQQKELSKAVLKRLPGYLSYLKSLPEDAAACDAGAACGGGGEASAGGDAAADGDEAGAAAEGPGGDGERLRLP